MAVSRSSGRLSAPVISPSSTSVANGNGSSAKLAAMSPKVLREAFWLANGHKVRLMRVAAAIVIAGALIAIAVLIAFRWQISAATGVVYRLDRWTGHAVVCDLTYVDCREIRFARWSRPMPANPKPSPDDPEQSKRFIEAAREVGTGESPEAFECVFKDSSGYRVSSQYSVPYAIA
jgi:hypothetical protein